MFNDSRSSGTLAADKSIITVIFAGTHEHLHFSKLLKELERQTLSKSEYISSNNKESHYSTSWMIVDYGDCFVMECRGECQFITNMLFAFCKAVATIGTCKVIFAKDYCNFNNCINNMEFVQYGCTVIDKIPPVAMESIATNDMSDVKSIALDIVNKVHSMINTICAAPQDKRVFTAENLRLSSPKSFPAHDLITLLADKHELLTLREYLDLYTAPLQFERDCEVNHPVDDPLKYEDV